MKYYIVIFSLFFSILGAGASEMLDVDYNFIDTAFDGIKPVTNKQFEETINRLTPQPIENSFKGKLKAFLFGRKYGVEPLPKGQDEKIDLGGEKQAIQDLKNGVYYITLGFGVISEGGNIIPAGNYKIQQITVENVPMLAFYQGHQQYGMLKLRKFEDNLKNENDIAYSRVDILSPEVARIVYSTITDTKCAIAKVYLQN